MELKMPHWASTFPKQSKHAKGATLDACKPAYKTRHLHQNTELTCLRKTAVSQVLCCIANSVCENEKKKPPWIPYFSKCFTDSLRKASNNINWNAKWGLKFVYLWSPSLALPCFRQLGSFELTCMYSTFRDTFKGCSLRNVLPACERK